MFYFLHGMSIRTIGFFPAIENFSSHNARILTLSCFEQKHRNSSLPYTNTRILELYRYHSGIAQQSENSHFAQDNSRIVPIPTMRRTCQMAEGSFAGST